MGRTDLSGKRAVVMGLGRFGGGIGVTRWLVGQGAEVTVTDRAPAGDLADSVAQLDDLPVNFHLGGHDLADLAGCDLLVVSPAVPKDRSEFVQAAIARGIPVTSEMNLFIERCRARRVVGITGSAGKSTTTAMTGAILAAAHAAGVAPRPWIGGNIGQSLLSSLEDMSPQDLVVLELSSFQLEDLGALRWSPALAVITNIQPNHLDRHGTLDAYAAAKLNVVRYQSAGDIVFVHHDDDELADRVAAAGGASRIRRYAFDPTFASALHVPGRHNRDNAAAAIAVARALDVPDSAIVEGLAGFTGLPHRLEFVAERNGVRYFNDSKSTTPDSTRIALEAFAEPVVMLVGGRDKGMPFDRLGRQLAARAKAVVCYGETRETLFKEVSRHLAAAGPAARVESADGFEPAIRRAAELAEPGDVVVLSPACTSYDMFNNYEQRGETFRRVVQEMAG